MKKQDKRIYILIPLAILINIAAFFMILSNAHAKKERAYQKCICLIEDGDYFNAQLNLDKLDGYKNVEELRIYNHVKWGVWKKLELRSSLLASINEIPTDYSGDCAEEIAALRSYLTNDYQRDYDAYWQKEGSECLRDYCSSPRVSDGWYCSFHECHHPGCHKEIVDGTQYCRDHQSDAEQETVRPATSSGHSGGSSGSSEALDPDDLDVEGLYEDNPDEFENVEDAWDYLDDSPEDREDWE